MRLRFIIFGFLILIISGCVAGNISTGDKYPKTNRTLILGRSTDAVGLDPADVIDSESFYVTNQVLESLLTYAPDTTEVIPALATSWDNSTDGLTWTFHLRQKVKFHDGTPFNAEAVKFNFDRWRLDNHPQHNGNFAYYRSMFSGFPGIIKDVRVVDEYTIKFRLTKPHSSFLSNLAMTSFAISSPNAIRIYGKDYSSHPVGTGPFRFLQWVKGKEITLESNEDYWGDISRVRRLVFRVISDDNERLAQLEKGSIHADLDISPSQVQEARKDAKLRVSLRPTMNIGYLAMNNNVEPMDKLLVRQALNHAINKKGLINKYYSGLAKIAKNPLPPSLWGYNDEVVGYEYNPAKAKALLAEAGYPEGFSVDLTVMNITRPYLPRPLEIARQIKEDLLRVGIKVNIKAYDWPSYLKKVEDGEHQLALTGWIGDNGDPDNFLNTLLDKNNASKGSATNLAFYKDDKVHDLLLRAQEETNQKIRAELYQEVQLIVNRDVPWVPLVHTTPPVAALRRVKNWQPHATGSEMLNRVFLE